MVVLDKTPDRFTPEALRGRKGAPVYLIEPADMLAKAAFRRELSALGARYPGAAEVAGAVRDGVRHGIAADQQDALLALIDRAEEVDAQRADAVRAAAGRGEGEAGDLLSDLPELSIADRADIAALERDMRLNYPPYAGLLADRQYYLDVAPVLAAQLFLVGWENVAEPFARDRGRVDLALLQRAVPEAQIIAIGHRAMALMDPDRDAEKNSASRPGSPAGRATSTAGSMRSTDRPGTSRAKSTKGTRGS